MKIFSRSRWQFGLATALILSLVLTFSLVSLLSSHSRASANAPLSASKIRHYGPFNSTSPDSGTCGNNWANDTFKRLFTVDTSNPNTFTENFNNGQFTTIAGQSPSACVIMAGPNGNMNTVANGVMGTFHGSFDVSVTGGVFNPNAKCTPTTCNTTAGFVATVYGSSATYNTGATYFDFDYATQENGGWHNASANRDGNNGDITGLPGSDPGAAPPVSPKHLG